LYLFKYMQYYYVLYGSKQDIKHMNKYFKAEN